MTRVLRQYFRKHIIPSNSSVDQRGFTSTSRGFTIKRLLPCDSRDNPENPADSRAHYKKSRERPRFVIRVLSGEITFDYRVTRCAVDEGNDAYPISSSRKSSNFESQDNGAIIYERDILPRTRRGLTQKSFRPFPVWKIKHE